jgi:hypothetical protein
MQPATAAGDCANRPAAYPQPHRDRAVRELTLFHQTINLFDQRGRKHGGRMLDVGS